MDDLKERIYLLALDMIKNDENPFICTALRASYREYIGTEELVSDEELEELFSEFFNLDDNKYWCYFRDNSIFFITRDKKHGCWWDSDLREPRKRTLELIISRNCR